MFNPFTPPKQWVTPPASILQEVGGASPVQAEHSQEQIAGILTKCGAPCVPACVTVGAAVVQYHLDLVELSTHSRAMRAGAAISAALNRRVTVSQSPIAHLCVSVPRGKREAVPLRSVLLTESFNALTSPTGAACGVSVDGIPVVIDIASMPHLLIAGATGSGKSILLHSIIGSMLFKGTPAKLQMLMIDPKQIELTMYDGLPHLARPVITDVYSAIVTLDKICSIMDNRYKEIRRGKTDHTRLVIVIDELADLMLTSKKAVEPSIVRIAQLGRAAGIHLVVATQRPTVNVVTGLIKANMPARIALTMASYRDAGVMEITGADKLAGKGDALFQGPDHTQAPIRFQGAYVSPGDTKAIVDYWTGKECKM